MTLKLTLLLLLVATFAYAADQSQTPEAQAPTESFVVVLDDSNYTSFIQEHPYVFVKFYAPWCGHCKAMIPEYEILARDAVLQQREYVVAKVDATVATKVAEEIGVDGYPTMKFVVNGHHVDYAGERNLKQMQKWLDSALSSQIETVTEDKVKELIGSTDFLLIQGASNDQLTFLRFGMNEGVSFYSLQGGDFKITLYLRNTKTLEYNGEINLKDLNIWIFQNTLSALVTLSSDKAIRYVFENPNKLPSFLLLRNKDWSDELSEKLAEYCEQNRDKFTCAWAGESHDIYQGASRFMKIQGSDDSALAYFDFGMKNGWKVPDLTAFTRESLNQFLENVSSGKADKFHSQDKGGEGEGASKKIEYQNVVKLTAETYNDTISKNDFVLIEYFTPTCGHCIALAPEYQKLAKKLKQADSKYVIAAVDMQAEQEVGNWVSVNGYPTIRFYVKGSQFDYENHGRKVEDFIKYMDKVVESKLKIIKSKEEVEIPAVYIYGIDADSTLQRLGVKFTRIPVYHVEGQSQFRIHVQTKKEAIEYRGDKNLDAVANWIDQATEETIIRVADPSASKKLNRALQNQTPLLIIMNRDDSAEFKHTFQLMQSYCQGKVEFVCGIASKDDAEYSAFDDWIKDPVKDKSRIVYLTTEKFEKFLYEGDLATLTEDAIEGFIQGCKDGKIKTHDVAPDETVNVDPQVDINEDTPVEEVKEEVVAGETLETGEEEKPVEL